MRGKIQPGPTGRRILALGGLALASLAWIGQPAEVSGRVTMLDKGDQPGDDVGQAVLWLSGPPAQSRPPAQAEIGTSNKEFSPHVLVVPVGSTVSFPNHDPFNHNVFSLSEENPFDLGLYGRDEVRSVRFERPGVIPLPCSWSEGCFPAVLKSTPRRHPASRPPRSDSPGSRSTARSAAMSGAMPRHSTSW